MAIEHNSSIHLSTIFGKVLICKAYTQHTLDTPHFIEEKCEIINARYIFIMRFIRDAMMSFCFQL